MNKHFWKSLGTAIKTILIILMVISIAGTGIMVWSSLNIIHSEPNLQNPITRIIAAYLPEIPNPDYPINPNQSTEPTVPETTEPPTTLPPEPEHVVSRATIGATGDILMHMPVVDTGRQSDGSYNFDYIFKYLSEYSFADDYAVANLETTLASNTNGYPYSGYPQFNCPDEIVDGLKNVGFDMLLTANNHSYDTGEKGYYRTIETVRSRGMTALGTMLNGEEPKYVIQNINGIKIGMLCYTYEGRPENGYAGRVYLNGLMMHEGAENVVNSFNPNNPAPFYEEVSRYLDEMRAAGAEATVMFIHWGVEYTTTPVASQTTIAQALCDMGIDVIVGGHAHVVEPVELLSSTVDPEHKTVCLYSMGNAVSNQRANVMQSQPSGHTEDGTWFRMTFCKYSDGTVYLEDVDLIPTWVDLRTNNGRRYYILPLDPATMDNWQSLYDMSDVGYSAAKRSFDRTMKIVGDGLAASRQYLAEQTELRDANYLAALMDLLYAA